MRIHRPVLSFGGSIDKITAVKLNSRLVGQNFHRPSRLRIGHFRCRANPFAFTKHPTMVVTASNFQRLKVRLNPFPNCGELPEIHRSSRHGRFFPSGNESLVGRKKVVRENLKLVIVDRRLMISREVPVAVVNEIHGRRLVRSGLRLPDQLVGIGQPVGHGDTEISRVAFLSVLGKIS